MTEVAETWHIEKMTYHILYEIFGYEKALSAR